jgi:hypothetical protein
MTRPRRSRLGDPTAKNESNVVGGRGRAEHEDVVRRTGEERDYTPRRYEQPVDADPMMPSEDSTLKTKI